MNLLFWLLLGLLSTPSRAESFWIVGKTSIGFYSPGKALLHKTNISAETTLLDEASCLLWVQSQNRFQAFDPSLHVVHQFESNETLLGSQAQPEGFFTRSKTHWTLRSREGTPLQTFKAPLEAPQEFAGNLDSGFWMLQLDSSESTLNLVHWSPQSALSWNQTLSAGPEIWGKPKLIWDPLRHSLWVGYSSTTPDHAYAPVLELWSTTGARKHQKIFSEKGLFLDGCLLPNGELAIARDLPSAPYTVPLFSVFEQFAPDFLNQPLFQATQNQLVHSMACSQGKIWSLQSSMFGGSPTQLTEWMADSAEQILMSQKDPAWKIHACSLQ